MSVQEAIDKLKTSNEGLSIILDNVHEQLSDISADPRLKGLTSDLENLFESYLVTWMKSNSEVLKILENAESEND